MSAAAHTPTAEKLRKLLSYNPETGLMTWKVNTGRQKKIGKIAGTNKKGDYSRVSIGGKTYLSHRIIWALHYGIWPSNLVDHINGEQSDNRISNLREATNLQNLANSKKQKNNKSGYKGVFWCAVKKAWVATIRINQKNKYIGKFSNAHDAALAHEEVAKEFHGEFYRNQFNAGGAL